MKEVKRIDQCSVEDCIYQAATAHPSRSVFYLKLAEIKLQVERNRLLALQAEIQNEKIATLEKENANLQALIRHLREAGA